MTQQDKGKNIFQKARDAVSNRDEKEAIEAAMQRAEELEKRVDELEKQSALAEQKSTQTAQKLAEAERKVTQLTAELNTAKSDLVTARNTVKVTEQRLAAANSELQKHVSADQSQKMAEVAQAAAKAQVMTEHTLKADESLSHLSLKYYGSAYEPYWRVIYEANKELIGDNPGRVRPGMVIIIPVLPEELKKK